MENRLEDFLSQLNNIENCVFAIPTRAKSTADVYLVPGFVTLTPGTIPGDPLRIQFPVAPAHSYDLQESTDLRSWTTIWQTTGVTNTWVEFDAPVAASGQQFFRVALH